MMFWKQLYLLLWKNFILRKRHPVRTVIEVLWPVVLLAVMVAIRKSQVVEIKGECHYPARAMPSAGVLPWFKSILCDIQNPCFSKSVASETPGQINSPVNASSAMLGSSLSAIGLLLRENTTILNNTTQLANDLQNLANISQGLVTTSNNTYTVSELVSDSVAFESFLSNLSLSQNVVVTILNSRVTLTQAIILPQTLGQRVIVCNESSLGALLQLPTSGPASLSAVSTELCNLADSNLTALSQFIGQNVNLTSQGISAVDEASASAGLSDTELSKLFLRLAGYQTELQSIQGPLQAVLNDVNQGSSSNLLLTSLLGSDLTSANGVNEFCGHPENKNTVVASLASGVGPTASLGIFFNANFAKRLDSATYCQNLTDAFANNSQLSVVWDTIKPILLGKIPYSPNTTLVQSIIKEANTTFEAIGLIQSAGEAWSNSTGPALYQSLESGSAANSLRVLLNTTQGVNLLNITDEQANQLKVLLSNVDNPNDNVTTWKDIYRQVDDTVVVITKLLNCVELDKFQGYESEVEMVQASLDLLDYKTLWGGLAFLSPSISDSTVMPEVVKYKIRQDSGAVTLTTAIQRFFWRPGAEDGTGRVKYYVSGFVHLQDLVESAILRVTGARVSQSQYDPVGSHLQMMPYPCYTRDSTWTPDAYDDPTSITMGYYTRGFLFLQDIIENGIIKAVVSSSLSGGSAPIGSRQYHGSYMQEFPYPCYTYDEFLEYLASLLSLIMTLSWIYSVCIIIKSIVYEKEQRLKEVMKMMGLSNRVHWMAWFINSFIVMLMSVILIVIVLKAGAITPFSNVFIVFIWLCFYAMATITQCFLISCFFSRANLAAAVGGILFFLFYIPYTMVVAFEDRMTLSTKLISCLLSNVAFGLGAGYISNYEMSGEGIQFSNWTSSPDPSDTFNFVLSLIMMLVDAVIYYILTWYIENVFPGRFGVPRRWYFFMTRSYWCGSRPKLSKEDGRLMPDVIAIENAKLETEPSHLELGVSMQNLRKVYGNGKVAVDDLSLNFYEGQITSFLGHNGAGKTTTMSMLTGLFTPTSGTANIYGSDICTEMDTIRHQLGFCPQHNVLFGDLTVREHLVLYSGLKNSKGGKEEIEKMLIDVGLPHKQDEVSQHLSGGMKRKLSVAVAFVGGSKCVILDEPTAGVDPYARRGIWDLLLSYRENRTIILSTHHMDEADLLGDRIAIISHGKLKCCGSSLFLKSCYGVGYYLTLVKKDLENSSNDSSAKLTDMSKASDEGFESNLPGDNSSRASSSSLEAPSSRSSSAIGIDADKSETPPPPKYTAPTLGDVKSFSYKDLVLSTIPDANVHEQDAREITFVLPYQALSDGRYVELFRRLDDRGASYGLEDTSLEEIFLNVAEQNKDEGKDEKTKCCFCIPRRRKPSVLPDQSTETQGRRSVRRSHSVSSRSQLPDEKDVGDADNLFDDGSEGAGSYKIGGNKLVFQQFVALFVKRFHHARRNRKGFVAQVIVPAVFVALSLAFALAVPDRSSLPPLELQPWMYDDSSTFFSNDKPSNNASSAVTNALLNSPGIGMRCVTNYSVLNYNKKYLSCPESHAETWGMDNSTKGTSQFVNSNQTETCVCTDKETRVLLSECPNGAGGTGTPLLLTETNNPMYNMTNRNVSDWMVKTTDRFIQARFGGLSIGETYHTSWTGEQFNAIIGFLRGAAVNNSLIGLENFIRTENVQVWFDNSGYHSMPTWLNVLNNAALRSLIPSHLDPSKYGIAAINHPLNYSRNQIDAAAFSQSATDTIISICVIFALSFVPASFVLFLIEEKVTKAKHLQFVSGVNQLVYWVANFLWDLVNYLVPVLIVTIIFACFQTKAYVSPTNIPCFILLLILYGFAITPMMYPASFYFTVPSTAYVALTCINIFIGVNASIATFILELLDDPSLNDVNYYLKLIFLIFPQYCLGRALIDMALNQAYADAYAQFGIDRYTQPLEFDLVGRNLMALAIEGVVFFTLTLLIQYRFFIKPDSGKNVKTSPPPSALLPDEDVLAEKRRILNGNNDDILQIKNLTKVYKKMGSGKPLVAVDRMNVGVPKGECFGLLGVNGAGKTTTFKMLTGDTVPTAGDAYICGQSILSDMREVQQNTGYCPQFEALNSLLTGREHLEFYAKLRGVPPEDIPKVADWGINRFGLKMYANKCAGTYSGGNKRKLSAAIAFIGCPPVVFLDEPTAGMDPMSRRFLWKRIMEAVQGGRCVVLTSHSMEECEALCTRLAIMVNGRYTCIGSPQHLKNRYGEGYTLSIRFDALLMEAEAIKSFVATAFPKSMLKEHHSNVMLYQIPLDEVQLSNLFETMESNKLKLHIEDYSISQTTLDEVFVSFAKLQTDGIEDEYGLQAQPEQIASKNDAFIPEDDGIVLKEFASNHDSSMKV